MSEQNNASALQNQKELKPKIEDIAKDFLDAEKTAVILDFVQFLHDKKVNVRWGGINSWTLNYKSKRLGYIKLHQDKNVWRFSHNRIYLDAYYAMEDCDFKTFIFDHIYVRACEDTENCFWNPDAPKAGHMNPTTCHCWPLRIHNPYGEKMKLTKQMVEYRVDCIPH